LFCWCCSSTTSRAKPLAILTTGSALALTHHHGCFRSVIKGLVGVGAVRKISNWFCIISQFHLPTVSNNWMNRGFNIVVQCPPNQDCEEFSPSERSHVEGGIEECMQLCQALNPLGRCEWLLYHYSPTNNAAKAFIPPYLNCELFATDDGSLDQYVNTCDKQGQPTRRHDGSCTATATNPSTGECNESICPSGCAPCDETDDCHRKYHETECSMLSPAIRVEPNTPDFDFCIALCTSTQDATYATWSHLDHNCM